MSIFFFVFFFFFFFLKEKYVVFFFFFFQAEDGIRDADVTGVQTCALPIFDAEAALRAIERHRCSSTFMAPTLLKRIVDLPAEVRSRYDVSSMRAIVMAAAPCPMRVKEEVVRHFGPVLYEFYGSTEL